MTFQKTYSPEIRPLALKGLNHLKLFYHIDIICIYVYMCVCVCIYIYIYIYRYIDIDR